MPIGTTYTVSELNVDSSTEVYTGTSNGNYVLSPDKTLTGTITQGGNTATVYFKNVRFFKLPETGGFGIKSSTDCKWSWIDDNIRVCHWNPEEKEKEEIRSFFMIFNKGKGKIKMRKIRKLLTVFAAFFLVLGLTTNVQAEADQNQGTSAKTRGSITIQNTLEGKTYTIYRMLDLESYKKPADQTDKGAYSYKVLPAWKGFLESGVGAQFLN